MGFLDKMKETADKAAQSINQQVSGAAAGSQVKQAQQQLEAAIRQLGIATFDLAQSGQLDHPALQPQLAAVAAAQQAAQAAQAAAAAPVQRPPVPGAATGAPMPPAPQPGYAPRHRWPRRRSPATRRRPRLRRGRADPGRRSSGGGARAAATGSAARLRAAAAHLLSQTSNVERGRGLTAPPPPHLPLSVSPVC